MRARLLCTLLVVLATFVAPTAVARAATSGNDQKTKIQQNLDEVSREQAAAAAQLKQIQSQKAGIDAKVAEINAQLSSAQSTLDPLAAQAASLTYEYLGVVQALTAKQAELDGAQRELDVSAVQLYLEARRGDQYDVITVTRPKDLVVGNKYLDHVSSDRRVIVLKVKSLRDELEAQRKVVADEKAQADAAAAAAQAERDRVAALRAQVEPARAQAQAAEDLETRALGNLNLQKQQLEAQLNALQASSDSISARLRALGNTPGSIGPCQARPVPGGIVSGYGMRFHPILHTSRLHSGADMQAGAGTPIHACRAGTVVIAGPQGGYGNATVIDHGGGMATLYAHQSRLGVSVGQHVNAGEVIGYVGSTGLATGPHLHFEVRISGNPVNPASYL